MACGGRAVYWYDGIRLNISTLPEVLESESPQAHVVNYFKETEKRIPILCRCHVYFGFLRQFNSEIL